MPDEEIKVEIEPEVVEGEVVATPETDPVVELKAQYDELQKKATADAEARADAERRAHENSRAAEQARREASQARVEVTDTQLDSIRAGIDAATSSLDSAKKEIKAAMEAADFERQAEAYDKLAEARARLLRLDEARADLEARKSIPQRPSGDPIEQYISGRTEPTQRWLREHRDWISDPEKNAKLTRAHYHAIGEGLSPDTDEYFAHVETRIGLRKERDEGGRFAEKGNGSKPVKRSSPPPAAPVSGSSGSVSSDGGIVKLTAGEARAATDGTHVWHTSDVKAGRLKDKNLVGQPIGHTEFARRKRSMMSQGLYDKSYSEA